ncbi:MAG: ATP-dependent nuclease [Promethearchaeota archaeon]
MRIQKVEIENFRTIKSCKFYLFPYTVFVGRNNAGKSNLMRALDVFYHDKVSADDFRRFPTGIEKNLSITIKFIELSAEEKEIYNDFLISANTPLEHVVIRYIAERNIDEAEEKIQTHYEFMKRILDLSSPAAKSRYGFLETPITKKKEINDSETIPQEFKKLIDPYLVQKGSNRLVTKDWGKLRAQYLVSLPNFDKLPKKDSFTPKKLTKAKLPLYFGEFFFIPAVQDIEEETTYRATGKTNIKRLMDFVMDKSQDPEKKRESNAKIEKLIKEIYQINKEDATINQLKLQLNTILKSFDGSSIRFDAEVPSISKIVRDSLKIYIDDGVETEVQDKGHGLQRYFMISLFKVWADYLLKNKSVATDESKPLSPKSLSAFFAIEEPELFLHPQYQRIMQSYLRTISKINDNQVILNTHSPTFIHLDQYHSIARVVKNPSPQGEFTQVIQPLKETREGAIEVIDISHHYGKSPTIDEKFKEINSINLNYFMDPNRSELFFADQVVLVEGETEKLMFPRFAEYFFPDHIEKLKTTTYIDMNGKYNTEIYQKMLHGFEIPYVVIIDNDRGSGDPKMKLKNRVIRNLAEKHGSNYIELNVDFENEFEITECELDRQNHKKNKPYFAFKKYFKFDGSPNVSEFDILKMNPKLRQIFGKIYNLSF